MDISNDTLALAGLIIALFLWLRQDIRLLGERIDKLDTRLGRVEQGLAALRASVETFFRLRVDPPPPPDNTTPDKIDKAA